jgi:hypothetical protein
MRYCRQCGCHLAPDNTGADCLCAPCTRHPYNPRHDPSFRDRVLLALAHVPNQPVRLTVILRADHDAVREAVDYWRRIGLRITEQPRRAGYVLHLDVNDSLFSTATDATIESCQPRH